jgi:hypothetical protein
MLWRLMWLSLTVMQRLMTVLLAALLRVPWSAILLLLVALSKWYKAF